MILKLALQRLYLYIFQKFRETIGFKIENTIEAECCFQEFDNLDNEFKGNFKRVKPLETGHAILCYKYFTEEPFIVINADDFYEIETYRILGEENLKKLSLILNILWWDLV
ncbi:hypothetical protein ELS18_03730 [Clostridium perfringens]|uniref:hypothetical protein n=1 Tax=Clostridium perfringens TaxID=1502 RepID=UPI000F8E1E98|nr:hypothetical protein [Clostridium perfringens]RUR40339.1 hypothetical protein ELS18_03730 [Clostridium perfringens]